MADKKKKEYKRASYEIFKATYELLQVSEAQLCEELGYSSTNASSWRREEKIPFVAGLACEALQRRHKQEPLSTTIVVRVENGIVTAARAVTGANKATMGGQEYMLVPVNGGKNAL